MFCCFRPPATRDSQPAAGSGPHEQELSKASGSAPAAADAGNQRWKSGSGLDPAQQQQQQQQLLQQHPQLQQQQQQVPLEPLARLGEGAALQAPGLQPTTSPHGSHDAAATAAAASQQHHITTQQQQLRVSEDAGQQAPQNDVLQLVALLQELLGLSTASPKQPLSKAMGLLVVRLPVDWACLHVFSSSGRVVMQVGAALSPEAQRQRGASGSCSYATPVGTTPVRQRLSYNNMLSTGSNSGSNAGALGSGPAGGASAGVQEVGAGHLAVLPGSGSSLELVSASRQALAMYAGDEAEAAALPPDWQRLYADRDLRSFLVVPIIASGSAGSIIGALSFGLTSITDWGLSWWMSSIQLLCGWAAGALPQNRATARAAFFDALWSAGDLQDVGRVFVQQLPAAMADQAQHKLEARLALVSSRVTSCVMFAGAPESRSSQEQQQHQQQQPGPQQKQLQQQQLQQQQLQANLLQPAGAVQQQQQPPPPGRSPSPSIGQLPEGITLADDVSVGPEASRPSSTNSRTSRQQQDGDSSKIEQQQGQQQEQQQQLNGVCSSIPEQPVSCFTLPTSNSVLLSALEWGEVMVVKDTVTYFGRNAAGGSSAVRDLFLPDRPMVRGTLVLLPLVYRCRALGCVYLLAPWDIHAEVGKAALQEMAALLASGTFKALLRGGRVQQEWYCQVLSEGPMPSVLELDSTSSGNFTAAVAAAAAATKQPTPGASPSAAAGASAVSDKAAAAPLTPAEQQQQQPAAAALYAAAAGDGEARSKSPAANGGWGSGDGQGLAVTGSCDSVEPSAASATGTGMASICSASSNAFVNCPLALLSAEAVVAAADAASSAAAAAAAIAPVGLPVSGHATSGFTDLVLWPELLDIKADLARSRHTAVYTAEYSGHLLAVKLFRYSSSTMDYAASSHPSQLHGPAGAGGAAGPAAAGISSLLGHHGTSSSSGGNVASEAELEAVLSLQYRLCNMQHEHLLQHVAVYPRVYEVVQRRSSREPPDVYLATMLPRKERNHRCAALISEYTPGGCLRDAVNRGQVHVPTATALQAAAAALGWPGQVDVGSLSLGQLQELLGQVVQQLPLVQQPVAPPRSSLESAAAQGMAGTAPLARLQQSGVVSAASAPLSPAAAGRGAAQDLQHLRQPHMPLLHQMLLHIALGMQHLHAHGIIHGELRLDNVMISGALPSTITLMQQQQQQAGAAVRPAAAGEPSQHAAAAGAVGDVPPAPGAANGVSGGGAAAASEAELPVRANSSFGSYSTGGVPEGGLGSSSGSQVPPASSASAAAAGRAEGSGGGAGSSGSSSSSGGFVLKLKDIGLCTLGYNSRQCTLRKLAGRPRLQAVCWLAPECFRGEGLSKYSDVYAFGILMWELYTGEVAFNDLVTSNTKVLQTIIGDGVRPQFPDSAPSWFVALANRCWAGAPKSRPSFRRIVQALQAIDSTTAQTK